MHHSELEVLSNLRQYLLHRLLEIPVLTLHSQFHLSMILRSGLIRQIRLNRFHSFK
jgi:hypothetical protein